MLWFVLNTAQTIQVLRFDNGGKYVNHQLQTYFTQHGLIHETSCPQTPQQNSVIKHKNMHLLEIARALLLSAHMPNCFHPMPYLLQFISSTIGLPRSWIFRPPSMLCPSVCHSPRHWCFLLGYLVVWHLYIFIKINVTSFICVHCVASSWAMVLIKKGTGVMILPPGDFMWLWMYISWRLIYSFLLRHQILLFMGRQMVKS